MKPALLSLAILVISAAGVAGCGAGATPQIPASDARVGVLHDGTILLDGHPDNLADVEARFVVVARQHGKVWYYRDGDVQPDAAGDQAIKQVIDLIVKYHLSVTLSSKPDYSDSIGSDGQPHPRRAQ